METNPTMSEQLARQEAERDQQEKEALTKLLDELKTSPREINDAERAFLQRQSDRLEEKLARSDSEAGTEHDSEMLQADQIQEILKN